MFNIFQETSIGIDIADHSIEVVELARQGSGYSVQKIGRVELRSGVVERGVIKDTIELARLVKKVFEIAMITPTAARAVVYGLPESKVYIHFAKLLKHEKKERNMYVAEEVRRAIPIDAVDLLYAYRVVEDGGDFVNVMIVAASKTVIEQWQSFFLSCGIFVAEIDIETLAVARGLFGGRPQEGAVAMVLDIGAVTSTVSIVGHTGIFYSHSIPVGGESLTQVIAKDLKLSIGDAEDRKRKRGFMHTSEDILLPLIKAFEPIIAECKSANSNGYGVSGVRVSELVCVGGSARTPGLTEYLILNLQLPVRVGSPAFVNTFPKVVDVKTDSLLYIEAVGLALGHFQNDDPVFEAAYQGHSFAKMFPWR
ncbi:MAG: pilus assembly protein PilM [Patescibacteria group bacterium]